ncbi:UNVERIFIED_CONTAM: hypothetical protein FKN15_055822 [Acipenser sinensis]
MRKLGIAREQPIFSARAHVFQIDPTTKRNWIPASKHSLTVSFFYDATRNVYRIISVGGTKAIINSTITPNMTFTKTSQKFGQWADSRANTVYGLGFSSEQQLQQDMMEDLQSPPVLCINGPGEEKLYRSQSADIELSSEKERIKKMLSEGSICELSWEAELFTLQDSNSKLVAALHEANANVEQWKKQLSAYQEETERLRDQVAELEAQGARHAACDIGKDELNQSLEELEAVLKAKDEVAELEAQGARHAACDIGKDELNQSLEELEAVLKAKDEEIHHLQSKKCDYNEVEQEREEAVQRLQEVESRNAELERRVHALEQTLSNSLDERSRAENEVQRIIDILDVKIFDLTDLRQSLATLVHK